LREGRDYLYNTPPIGAANATATPADTAADMISLNGKEKNQPPRKKGQMKDDQPLLCFVVFVFGKECR
jgi:hypothetical protein